MAAVSSKGGRGTHLVGVVLGGCVALAVAAACSSDEGSSDGPNPAAAGAGGEPVAVGGGLNGAGGSAGEVSSGGSAEGGQGKGGEGGEPPTAGEQCGNCTSAACVTEQAACQESPTCSAWQACTAACNGPECARECDAAASDAANLLYALYACACSSCEDDCAALEVCGETCTDDIDLPLDLTAPASLADTGLYIGGDGAGGAGGAGGASGTSDYALAPYVKEYRPEFELFSDAAEKTRYIYLPKCSTIDTGDMDHWDFPVGTRIWKQFNVQGKPVETRLMERFGEGTADWLMAAYQWPADANAATAPSLSLLANVDGVPEANGTTHDIPSVDACNNCHTKLNERVLGFSALQLSHELPGLALTDLASWGQLTSAPAADGYDPPGDADAKRALGYLHANCGHCHNETGVNNTNGTQPQSLWTRLLVGHDTVEKTHAVTTGEGQETVNGLFSAYPRINLASPEDSSIIKRMESISPGLMPPVGRQTKDDLGISAVVTWIRTRAL